MKASDLFVKQLEEEGVEYIFGLPGEENLDLLESISKYYIKLILTRHEQAAAFMAATHGRLTGRAGVCLSTLGPGATNLVTGIAHAQLIGAPVVSISGQKALRENRQARFQLIDVVSLMRPITKSAISIVDPGTIPTVLRNAFKLAHAERPGAVHVELPQDVASGETDAPLQKRGSIRRSAPDPQSIVAAAGLINRARYPLIIVSSGANRKLVSGQIREFVERTGIYLVHTQMGKGVLSDTSEYSLYATGIHGHDYVNCAIDKADLIITVGYNIVEYPPYIWNENLDKKIISIDFAEAEVDKYFNPEVEVVGDISFSLQRLAEKVVKKGGAGFRPVREMLDRKLSLGLTMKYPPTPHQIVLQVRSVLDEDDILVLDNGIYKLWFSRLYRTYKPNSFLVDNALATMGAGLPAGMAAKMLNPDRRVISVVGDGGFMMNSQELETAVRYKIPIVILLLNDNGFGFIRWKQKSMGFRSFGVDYSNPDFARYAETYGAAGMRVGKGDNLTEMLEKAFSQKKPVLIDCPVDYSPNYETFSREIELSVCDLVFDERGT
ncbi:MAG: acetolactate synthase large subunit [Candidatus Sulfobium sp.]